MKRFHITTVLLTLGACEPDLPELSDIISDFEQETGRTFTDCGVALQVCDDPTSIDVVEVAACLIPEQCAPRQGVLIIHIAAVASLRMYYIFPNGSGGCEYHVFSTQLGDSERLLVHDRCADFRVEVESCEHVYGVDCIEIERFRYSGVKEG